MGTLSTAASVSLGSSLVLNGGNFLFTGTGSTAAFSTPVVVAAGGGDFEANSTTTHAIAGPISLGGLFGIGDPVQQRRRVLGHDHHQPVGHGHGGTMTPFDQNGGDGTYALTLSGNIVDAAGTQKNPLILRCT